MLLLNKMRVFSVKIKILLQNKGMKYNSKKREVVLILLFDLLEAII